MKTITVGIVGAGQLGRMMALAGIPLGLRFEFLDTNINSPAAGLGPVHQGTFDDPVAISALASRCDVVTFDVENVPAQVLLDVADDTSVAPAPDALSVAQDRLNEKTLFEELGIATPAWRAVDSLELLRAAVSELGYPCVLKTRRMGYDGRGQVFIRSQDDIEPAWQTFSGQALIIESFVDFVREVSQIAVRDRSGNFGFYALCENTHRNGVLHRTDAPCVASEAGDSARGIARSLMEHLDYVGVLTMEFFETANGLVANEIAPRVHNSGHWTIEGAVTSQFENHMRAICNLPIGDCSATGHSTMINFLGAMPSIDQCLSISRLHYHDYGKSPRPSRKIGHATIVADSRETCEEQTERLLSRYTADL